MDTIEVGRRVTLHLGVVVQPYRSKSKKASPLTTADVAQFLETKYGLMQRFFDVKSARIAHAGEWSIVASIDAMFHGRYIDPFGQMTQSIQTMFNDFISSREAEVVGIPGTPTKAALRGVNHRLKHPYAKSNPRRASFIDTGLYLASFRAWVD